MLSVPRRVSSQDGLDFANAQGGTSKLWFSMRKAVLVRAHLLKMNVLMLMKITLSASVNSIVIKKQ
jgi:hypothetical protein